MARVEQVNHKYQNNKSWAIQNKEKGFWASCLSTGSTVSGLVKACSSKDSKIYTVSNFCEKVFYSFSNCLQYFLFGRKDDVIGDDEEKRPLAGTVGKVASFQEKYINPIVKPALVLLKANQQEGLNDAFGRPILFENVKTRSHILPEKKREYEKMPFLRHPGDGTREAILLQGMPPADGLGTLPLHGAS